MTVAALTPLAAPEQGEALSSPEKRRLGMRLLMAMFSGGLLLVALCLRWGWPEQAEVATLVATVASALVAGPVLVEAWHSIRRPSLHGITDQLVAVAVIAAWAEGDLEAAALVPLAMVIGHVLEERSLLGTRDAIAALARLTRARARKIAGASVADVDAEALAPGDRIEIRPGDRVPADGNVLEGTSSIDTAPITGESVPVEVGPGDQVHAGTVNHQGRLTVEVTRTGSKTTLGQVMELMHRAEESKPPITRLLERFAGPYLVLVLLIAGIELFATGDATAMLAVIVSSCPCALVLAAPATAIAAIAVAARHGILIKGSAFLEELADVDAIVFDKTGTLTLGELRVVAVRPADGASSERAQRLAASLGAHSSHPVSRALARTVAPESRLAVSELTEASGMGVSALVDGRRLLMGRAAFLARSGVDAPPLPEHDGPVVGLAADGAFLAWMLLADEPRPEAAAALASLRAIGLDRQILLTGDRAPVARAIAGRLGITEIEAEVVPERKLARVLSEIASGRRPLVVGDGINDALALKAGAVGVAMGAQGTDVALASSDVVLTTSDLRRLATCVRLSRLCRRTISINVAIGLAWTLLVLAGAALKLYPYLVAIILHNVGTLAVMANAGRLLRFDEMHPEPARAVATSGHPPSAAAAAAGAG
jgi:Cd2+/Zn2+-exporting ATPase